MIKGKYSIDLRTPLSHKYLWREIGPETTYDLIKRILFSIKIELWTEKKTEELNVEQRLQRTN